MANGISPEAEFQQHLQQLSSAFALRLQEEMPLLKLNAERLLHSSEPHEQLQHLQALRDQLHKLAGAAGTFGFSSLGQRARELEQEADKWLDTLQKEQQSLQDFSRSLLQLASEQFQAPVIEEPAVKRTRPARSNPSSRRIYILEDQPAIGESMRLTLNNFGYQAEHFMRIADLEQALDRQLPGALIVDVNLPDEALTGLQYAAQLQQRLDEPLPLLVITTQDDFATHLEAVRVGALGFFTKPVDITQLENRLERCFAQQQGEPYRVMIIDDDRELASRFSLILRDANMLVEMLHEPSEIFARMRSFNPEVVLLDVCMPCCTGPELAQIIRMNDDWLRVPIVYLSAETDNNRQMNALIKAGDDFLTKPISDNALIAAVFSRAQRARLLSNALSRSEERRVGKEC